MIKWILDNKIVLEAVGGICTIIFVIMCQYFSQPIQKIKSKIDSRRDKKRDSRINETKEALEPILTQISELSDKIADLQKDITIMKKADQEQLRQWMDHIYFKHLNNKTITQHDFERYQSLQNNYEAEGGNGTYASRWKEVQTWTKTK